MNEAAGIRFVEHGDGRPVLILHGAGVDHRETEACFEPALAAAGLRRVYPDLPGMGMTATPSDVRSAEDVLEWLLRFARDVTGRETYLLVGHSAGAYYARAMADADEAHVVGLTLVCPLLPDARELPQHRIVEGSGDIGDDEFRSYFVVQTPEMLERYRRYVAPAAALIDGDALDRIGERWELPDRRHDEYAGPTLVLAGRVDSTVGYVAAADLARRCAHASFAVLDDAGHALPHEQPDLLRAHIREWLARVERGCRSALDERTRAAAD